MRCLSALALLPTLLLGGCLSTAQQQKLIADGCALAADAYAAIPPAKIGPKTRADYAAVQTFCNLGTSPLFADLADALAAFKADKAAGN